MAEANNIHGSMDIGEQRQTYERFIAMVKWCAIGGFLGGALAVWAAVAWHY